MNYEELLEYAGTIPELGCGGKSIKNTLIEEASRVPKENSIIDIAPWLGSSTAYICLGTIKSGNRNRIETYDMWKINEDLKLKAAKHHKKDYEVGQSIEQEWRSNIALFECDVVGHRESIRYAKYEGAKIGLIVDDICNGKILFDHLIQTFIPFSTPGETVLLLMDYYQFERRSLPKYNIIGNRKNHLHYQYEFMQINKNVFEFIERVDKSYTAKFVYNGGEINYLSDDICSEYSEEIANADLQIYKL